MDAIGISVSANNTDNHCLLFALTKVPVTFGVICTYTVPVTSSDTSTKTQEA